MKNAIICSFFVALIINVTTGCAGTGKTSDANVIAIEYTRLIELLSDPKQEMVLVDVRPAVHYAPGHIPGAINIPITELRRADPRLARAKHIVLYSHDVSDMLSRAACKKLLRYGYKNVFNFQGGLQMWKNLHQPQETE